MAKSAEKLQKIPRGETSVVSYYSENQDLVFVLTRKSSGGFCLYQKNKDETWSFLGRGDDPSVLERKFYVAETLKSQK